MVERVSLATRCHLTPLRIIGLAWLRAWILVRPASGAIMIQVSSGSGAFIEEGGSGWW
jgi:hypothetical protein